jgi:hypothetical protein
MDQIVQFAANTLGKRPARPIFDHDALVKHNNIIRNFDHLLGMGDKNHCQIAARGYESTDRFPDDSCPGRIEAGGGFVENQDLGLAE